MVASHVTELARLGLSLSLAAGRADRVLWSAERQRAASLRIQPVLPPAGENLAALRAQLRATTGEAERGWLAGRPVPALNRRQHALEEELRQRVRHYRRSQPSHDPALEEPTTATTAAGLTRTLTTALGDAALVEYVECNGALHAVVVTGAGAGPGRQPGRSALYAVGPLAPLKAELEALLFAYRRLLAGQGSAASLDAAARLAAHAAGELDQALLKPLIPLIGDHPLVVVPAGLLQSLPWPMLPSCTGRPVTIAPSAGSWLADRRGRHAAPSSHRVILIAGPGLSGGTAEINPLAELYPGARVLAGLDATAAALEALNEADVAHIAAHGHYRADNPMFSSLILADGPLTVYDLERLDRAPATIMLAASDTALTTAYPGDEMTGLASALLAIGASSVVASLLPLPDKIAERLARAWHRHLRTGMSPAEALQRTAEETAQEGGLAKLAAAAMVCLGHGG